MALQCRAYRLAVQRGISVIVYDRKHGPFWGSLLTVSLRRFAVCLIVACSGTAVALADDINNAKDHPLVSRFPDTDIVSYSDTEFADFRVATGPLKEKVDKQSLPPLLEGEGKVVSVTYRARERTVSALQIFRNFEDAFEQSGFRKIFSCDSDRECGKEFVVQLYHYGDSARRGQHTYLSAATRKGERTRYFYWSGRTSGASDSAVISLLVVQGVSQKFPAVVVLDVNESDSIELGKVAIDLNALGQAIRTSGRAVLDGILFDLDKTSLKPASADTVAIVAQFLQDNPDMAFFVVGHTDSTGDYAYNRTLSEARAKTVVDNLTTTHGIDASRLLAVGIGPVSPATTNATDNGRSVNRRVELVQR
ncbi:MAG: OmpA family protein [Pseudomonadota bacterium]